MEPTTKIKCLLIDDDQEDIEIFQMALEELPIPVEIIAFNDCEQALKLITEDKLKPDCVFLDSFLLKTKDPDCLSKIQAIEKIANAPIVVLADDSAFIKESEFTNVKVTGILYKQDSIDKFRNILHSFFISQFAK